MSTGLARFLLVSLFSFLTSQLAFGQASEVTLEGVLNVRSLVLGDGKTYSEVILTVGSGNSGKVVSLPQLNGSVKDGNKTYPRAAKLYIEFNDAWIIVGSKVKMTGITSDAAEIPSFLTHISEIKTLSIPGFVNKIGHIRNVLNYKVDSPVTSMVLQVSYLCWQYPLGPVVERSTDGKVKISVLVANIEGSEKNCRQTIATSHYLIKLENTEDNPINEISIDSAQPDPELAEMFKRQ